MEFSEYLAQLKDPAARLSVAGLQQLASLEREQAAALRSRRPQGGAERRRQVVHQLMELAEDNVDLNFDAVFFAALDDEDAGVRADAVRGLWEYEGGDLIAPLLRLLEKDEEPDVRAEAALALGRFVVLSELGSLREEHFQQVEEGLRQALGGGLGGYEGGGRVGGGVRAGQPEGGALPAGGGGAAAGAGGRTGGRRGAGAGAGGYRRERPALGGGGDRRGGPEGGAAAA